MRGAAVPSVAALVGVLGVRAPAAPASSCRLSIELILASEASVIAAAPAADEITSDGGLLAPKTAARLSAVEPYGVRTPARRRARRDGRRRRRQRTAAALVGAGRRASARAGARTRAAAAGAPVGLTGVKLILRAKWPLAPGRAGVCAIVLSLPGESAPANGVRTAELPLHAVGVSASYAQRGCAPGSRRGVGAELSAEQKRRARTAARGSASPLGAPSALGRIAPTVASSSEGCAAAEAAATAVVVAGASRLGADDGAVRVSGAQPLAPNWKDVVINPQAGDRRRADAHGLVAAPTDGDAAGDAPNEARGCSQRGERRTVRSASGFASDAPCASVAARRGEMLGGDGQAPSWRQTCARVCIGEAVGVGWRKARTSASDELAMKSAVGDGATSRDEGM